GSVVVDGSESGVVDVAGSLGVSVSASSASVEGSGSGESESFGGVLSSEDSVPSGVWSSVSSHCSPSLGVALSSSQFTVPSVIWPPPTLPVDGAVVGSPGSAVRLGSTDSDGVGSEDVGSSDGEVVGSSEGDGSGGVVGSSEGDGSGSVVGSSEGDGSGSVVGSSSGSLSSGEVV